MTWSPFPSQNPPKCYSYLEILNKTAFLKHRLVKIAFKEIKLFFILSFFFFLSKFTITFWPKIQLLCLVVISHSKGSNAKINWDLHNVQNGKFVNAGCYDRSLKVTTYLFTPLPSTTFAVKVHVGARDISMFLFFRKYFSQSHLYRRW